MKVTRSRKTLLVLVLLTTAPFAVTCPRKDDALSSAGTNNPSQSAARSSRPTGGAPALPAVTLNTAYVQPSGKTIKVSRGGDFQAALDSARPGDQILLEAGAEFQGNFKLPKKEGDRWIVVRTSAPDTSLPQDARVSPSQRNLMPKLLSPNASPVVRTSPGAHHYRFVGIEISITDSVKRISALVSLGEDDHTSLDAIPHDLIFDRCFIHGSPSANVRRGIALNSSRTSVIDSHISDCHERGADSQAICGWTGPGPFKIVNNYLEGAGENVMFGGGDARIEGLVPSDIEIRRNHFAKPVTWMKGHPEHTGVAWTVKNLLELKNARRVLIDGNLFEHNWKAAQTGYSILFKSANSSGRATWSVTEDVTFTNNVVRHTAAGINILGRDYQDQSEQVKRVLISNNLFYGIDRRRWGGDGAFLKITETAHVTVDHNTVLQTGNIMVPYGKPSADFTFTNNLILHNKYGVKGSSTRVGAESLETYFPGAVFKNNAIIGGRKSYYPDGNFFPATLEDVKFVDPASGEYRLSASSPYKSSGTGGRAIGCDMEALRAAIGPLEKAIGRNCSECAESRRELSLTSRVRTAEERRD